MPKLLTTFFVPTEPAGQIFFVLIFGIFLAAITITIQVYRRRLRELKALRAKLKDFKQIKIKDDIFDLEKELLNGSVIEGAWAKFKTTSWYMNYRRSRTAVIQKFKTTLIQLYRRRLRKLKKLRAKLKSLRKRKSKADINPPEKEPIIADAWWEFKTTLVYRDKLCFAKTSFHEFFHIDSLESHKILTPRVAASIPSTLTVLGILGTFVSLVIGLNGLHFEKPGQLLDEVGPLLKSVNTAYVKSIWGVGGSVIFLFVDRWTSDRLRYQIEKMATQFDRLFVFESSESWLVQILEQQVQQTAALKAFNTDLSDAIRKELSGQIQQANSQVIEALGGMGAQVTSVARENAKGQEEAIREVLSDVVRVFRDQMIEAVKNGMSELTNSLELVAGRMEVFGESAGEITVAMRGVTGDLDSAQRNLGVAVGKIEGTLTSLSETVTESQKAAEYSRKTIEQLVREQKSTTEILGQFDSVVGKVTGVVAAMERCQKETEDAASEIADSVAALDENMTAFAGWFEKANTTLGQTTNSFATSLRVEVEQCSTALSSGLSQAADSLKQVLDSSAAALDENLTTFADRFETVNTTLGDTSIKFAESVRSEIERYCSTLDNSLESASKSLRGTVLELEHIVREIQTALPNASTSLGTGLKSMEDALKRLEISMARLKPDEGTLRETTTLLTALKAWEVVQKQERQS
jgi:hypothetical protein